MRSKGRSPALCRVLLVLWLTGCVGLEIPALPAPLPDRPSSPAPPAVLEREIHALVNEHRARMRLPALAYDDRLADIAREHSRAMATGTRPFGHAGFDERSAEVSRILPMRSVAENVAYNSRTGAELAPSLVGGWIASAGHRRNIEGNFDLTGIGAARAADGYTYVTQIFMKRRDRAGVDRHRLPARIVEIRRE